MTWRHNRQAGFLLLLTALWVAFTVGCGNQADDHAHTAGGIPALPTLTPVNLDGRPLRVVATTNVIGDVVGQVAGSAVALTVLMGANTDPHTYQPRPGDLAAIEQADVIFINGWNLEERLVPTVEKTTKGAIAPISAGITPRALGADSHGDADHSGTADPHVWFDIAHVQQWTRTAAEALGALDPANAAVYNANRDAYLAQLDQLATWTAERLSALPPERRKLVTDHDALGYFAAAYDFEVVGAVIPSLSTSAEPSANALAALVTTMRQEGVCTLFTDAMGSDRLAQTAAAELTTCPTVRVLPLHTGSLGVGEAGSYLGMYRANVETIVAGLQP